MTGAQIALSLVSGSVVGLSLGLVGGGGSILAVPLMVYVIGVSSPHVAIGTSAVAVAVSALINLFGHARAQTVKWPCAIAFALAGIIGAAIGAHIGKAFDGKKLLAAFGVLMIVIAALMLRPRKGGDNPAVRLNKASSPRLLPPLAATGFGVGALSGFFGIGGGFLIVPGLVTATSMPLLNAIGSSLVSVATFGATTAVSYALSDLVDWTVAALFVGGSILGSWAGVTAAKRLSARKRLLTTIFSTIVALVGFYVTLRGLAPYI
ncbi:MAG TPA: sulfite exporter TauE/SafE family protein [Alphaproteobacteria bacterium]|nr:sulfite exporter TauE/SafE family protein [Alphaproteobacteria bacterium]